MPERRCVGCGQRAPKATLARFVAVVDGAGYRLTRDDVARNAGRGVYTCRNRACFNQALARRGFARGARVAAGRLVVDDQLADTLTDDLGVRPQLLGERRG